MQVQGLEMDWAAGSGDVASLPRPPVPSVVGRISHGQPVAPRTPRRLAGKAVYLSAPPAPARTLTDILKITAARFPAVAAIDDGQRILTYGELLTEVSALGTRLSGRGVGWGDRVGVRVPSGSAELYVAILSVLAIGAAYVPVDVDDPEDRAELVWAEAGVCTVIGDQHRLTARPVPPRGVGPRHPRPSDDAWIIFTSGSTGTPKGVAVSHRSAAAFVDAEARLFVPARPLGPDDRVLAGLSVAFDASCEEMWLAWRHGACLVPAPRSLVKGGAEFGDWIAAQGISVVSTVPTLAGLWTNEQLSGVRLLILGGEACPPELANRLATTCPEVWNTYGPTETTVVACAARLTAQGPVPIGLPLEGWQLAVADPRGRLVNWGEVGELVIAGVGTARYLDPEKDATKFVSLPSLRWRRAYRSGDLVRADPRGLSYLGRVDTQVKIRGYRIELSEIESVLLQTPGIGQAVVSTFEPRPGVVELVGYYKPDLGATVDQQQLYAQLRTRLPNHMVPAYLRELAVIPTMTSGKVDRKSLPAPTARCAVPDQQVCVQPTTETETVLAEVLCEVLGLEQVSIDSHFFEDLGASSLTMAHFCTGVRQRAQLPPLSMKDVYLHPTVSSLADALGNAAASSEPPSARAPSGVTRVSNGQYLLCGALQLLVLLTMAFAGALMTTAGVRWVLPATDVPHLYLRVVAATAAAFVVLCGLPILAKWVLMGRWQEREIQIWSLDYVRFWTVKTLIRANPMAMFSGSPLYVLYLRALGAKIGRGVVIFSNIVPVCTDLLTIGDDTVIRKGCSFTGYRAQSGVIYTGRITIGRDVVIGDSTFIDIDAAMGRGSQLGHSSSLHSGQAIPAGQSWHGSPAQPTDVDYRVVGGKRCDGLRRATFATVQLLKVLLVFPLLMTAVLSVSNSPWLTDPLHLDLPQSDFYLELLRISAIMFYGGVGLGLAIVVTVPRVLNLAITPDRVYPLYGFAYWIHRTIARITSAPFLIRLYGDSSYIVSYLRALGYQATPAGQTGSNFGAALTHETPYLVSVGAGTMVSDGVGFRTADFSNTSFHTSPVSIGSHSFLGNMISVPSGGRLGDNCFVGTKTMIPIDGHLRQNVGLLGSPPFEIPRTRRDQRFDLTRNELRKRLRAKDKYNLRTIAIFLVVEWIRLYLTMLPGFASVALYDRYGPPSIALGSTMIIVVNFAYSVLVERAATSFRHLQPRYCSIYDRYFWWHERFWKLSTQPTLLNGTPFKTLLWRLLGVQIGRRVFDDGCRISEKTLVSIGDDTTINSGTILQSHSMEDAIFKSDWISIGNGCTIGSGAYVHYGVTIEDGARLDTDSFLMKGENVAPHTRWRGNPAQEIR
ncbi:MAG: amino acid adenylation domain-containing protein [Actinomycetota bacterium]|nr:amino acid adenylation domain-containing protein [Actinomycetota bacterium]